jgi:hypothetical protein
LSEPFSSSLFWCLHVAENMTGWIHLNER